MPLERTRRQQKIPGQWVSPDSRIEMMSMSGKVSNPEKFQIMLSGQPVEVHGWDTGLSLGQVMDQPIISNVYSILTNPKMF